MSERMSDAKRAFIEGMSVSVDVSTGDHDAGHRFFGTVTEVMDDKDDKHGVTLLVQEATPNFVRTDGAALIALLRDIDRWRKYGTSLPRKIEGFGTIGDFNVFAVDLWKRVAAVLERSAA